MVYTQEFDTYNFEAWSGAVDTINKVIDAGKAEELNSLVDEIFDESNPPSMTDINDWLWFDSDQVFEMLGISDEDEEDYDETDEEVEEDESVE